MNLDIWLGCSIPSGAELLTYIPDELIARHSSHNKATSYQVPVDEVDYRYRYLQNDLSYPRPDLAYPTVTSNMMGHDMISFCFSSSSNDFALYNLNQFVKRELPDLRNKYNKVNVFWTPTQPTRMFSKSLLGSPMHIHRMSRHKPELIDKVDYSSETEEEILAIQYYPESCMNYYATNIVNGIYTICKTFDLDLHIIESWMGVNDLADHETQLWSADDILVNYNPMQERIPKPNFVEGQGYDHINSNNTKTQYGHFSDIEHETIAGYIVECYDRKVDK